jgi:23S rRNA (guanosine2251-2'-O)-methyltransferase
MFRTKERALGGEQIEGRQAIRELLIAGRRKVYEIWMATDLDPAPIVRDILEIAQAQRVPITEVARRRLDAEARTEAAQGMLAKAESLPESELDDLLVRRKNRPAPFLLAVDGVTDPGNLGAILRSAECAGVSGVVLPRHRAAHITPTVAKTAAGAVEYLDMAVVSGLPSAILRMKEAGVWVVGLDGEADQQLYELGATASEPICLVMGAEGEGLSRLVRERCDAVVSIPMTGRVGSLNVSAAAALACFEIARVRSQGA